MPAGCFAVFWDIYSFLHDDALGMRDRMLAQRAICAALEPRRDARCVERMRTGQQHHLCPCSHLIDANRADVQLLIECGQLGALEAARARVPLLSRRRLPDEAEPEDAHRACSFFVGRNLTL